MKRYTRHIAACRTRAQGSWLCTRSGMLYMTICLAPLVLAMAMMLDTSLPFKIYFGFDDWVASSSRALHQFVTLTLSVVVEALPFLVVGVLIAGFAQYSRLTDRLIARLPKNVLARRFVLSFVGVALPVCECGNIPLMRSFIRKGLSVPDAVAFLFAAPVVNPVTIVATMTAFTFWPEMTWWRVGAALVIAQGIALVASRFSPKTQLQDDFVLTCSVAHHKKVSLLDSMQSELWTMSKMLLVGALIAAATQVFVPRDVITAIGSNVIMSIIAMTLLGIVISICSSVDAFFALAYARSFPPSALLSFLVIGPIVDIKIFTLLKTTFTTRFILTLFATAITMSIVISFGASYVLN